MSNKQQLLKDFVSQQIQNSKQQTKPIVNSDGFKNGEPPAGSNWRILGDTLYNPTPYPIQAVSDNGITKTLNPFDESTVEFPGAKYVDEYQMKFGGLPKYQGETGPSQVIEDTTPRPTLNIQAERPGLWTQFKQSYFSPQNWGRDDLSDNYPEGHPMSNYMNVLLDQRSKGNTMFMWKNKKHSTEMPWLTRKEQLEQTGITDAQLYARSPFEEMVHENIDPFSYEDKGLRAMLGFFGVKEQRREDRDNAPENIQNKPFMGARTDAFNLSMGKPQRRDTFSLSEYRPSKAGESGWDSNINNMDYFAINKLKDPKIQKELIDVYFNRLNAIDNLSKKYNLTPELVNKLKENKLESTFESAPPKEILESYLNDYGVKPSGNFDSDLAAYNELAQLNTYLQEYDPKTKNVIYTDNKAGVMGNFTLGQGVDENGKKYVSYYDKWDIETPAGMIPFGKPYHIYDRMYYQDAGLVATSPYERIPKSWKEKYDWTPNVEEEYIRFKNDPNAPDNLRFTDDLNDYNVRGMWDSLERPANWEQALTLYKDLNGEEWVPEEDGYYHAWSQHPGTGEWLKPKHHSTAWMNFAGYPMDPYSRVVVNPEGFFGDETLQTEYKKDGGLTKYQKGRQVVYTDPEEFKIANQAYRDSSDAYNLTQNAINFIKNADIKNRADHYRVRDTPPVDVPLSYKSVYPTKWEVVKPKSAFSSALRFMIAGYKKPETKPVLQEAPVYIEPKPLAKLPVSEPTLVPYDLPAIKENQTTPIMQASYAHRNGQYQIGENVWNEDKKKWERRMFKDEEADWYRNNDKIKKDGGLTKYQVAGRTFEELMMEGLRPQSAVSDNTYYTNSRIEEAKRDAAKGVTPQQKQKAAVAKKKIAAEEKRQQLVAELANQGEIKPAPSEFDGNVAKAYYMASNPMSALGHYARYGYVPQGNVGNYGLREDQSGMEMLTNIYNPFSWGNAAYRFTNDLADADTYTTLGGAGNALFDALEATPMLGAIKSGVPSMLQDVNLAKSLANNKINQGINYLESKEGVFGRSPKLTSIPESNTLGAPEMSRLADIESGMALQSSRLDPYQKLKKKIEFIESKPNLSEDDVVRMFGKSRKDLYDEFDVMEFNGGRPVEITPPGSGRVSGLNLERPARSQASRDAQAARRANRQRNTQVRELNNIFQENPETFQQVLNDLPAYQRRNIQLDTSTEGLPRIEIPETFVNLDMAAIRNLMNAVVQKPTITRATDAVKGLFNSNPIYKGEVQKFMPSFHATDYATPRQMLMDVKSKLDQGLTGLRVGDVGTGSTNTSHNSYLNQMDFIAQNAGKQGLSKPVFLGYEQMNPMGYLSNAAIPDDEIFKYINTKLNQIQQKRGVNFNLGQNAPYVNEAGSIMIPQYGVRKLNDSFTQIKKQEGGSVLKSFVMSQLQTNR